MKLFATAALFLAATLPFAGANNRLPVEAIASVNGQAISTQLFESLLKNDRQALMANGGGQAAALERLPDAVLEELIDRILVAQELEKRDASPNESEIEAAEKNILASFTDENRYQAFLAENNLTREQYRHEVIRAKLSRERLVQELAQEHPVTTEQVAAYYQTHQQESTFQFPERVAVAHINLNLRRDWLAARLQHGDPGLTSDALEKAIEAEIARRRALAQDLLRQLKAGADFGALAAKYSDDPGSRQQGGELPAFPRRAHPREFEEAAFALQKPGDLSAVVGDFYGLHILKLREHAPPRSATLEEATPEIRARLERERESAVFQDWLKAARVKAVIVKRA